ncbi:MAG: CDP-glycerol glycerophosphotransferase family protein [Verrucomicrobiota bacterium]
MAHESHPRVAFVGWNPFQFVHFAPVIARVPGAEIVIEKKHGAWKSCEAHLAAFPAERIHHLGPRQMRELDSRFDVLVCQTPFTGIAELRRARVAMLQYGYAKEAHNYGAWRSFADVCMTFGDYAARKIEPFCAAVAIGNPRFECWADPTFHERARAKFSARLDPAKKTLLYAPTWGSLSNHQTFADAIFALSGDCNVILKIHHNTQHFDARSLDALRQGFGVLHGADEDIVELLAVSDVLLSDFSGAIFDAIQCEVPVVLLGGSAPDAASDCFSIEQARRHELGEVALTVADLPAAVARALEMPNPRAAALNPLKDDLFCDAVGAADRAAAVIQQLADGGYTPSQAQLYLRREMAALQDYRSRSKWLRLLGRWWRG